MNYAMALHTLQHQSDNDSLKSHLHRYDDPSLLFFFSFFISFVEFVMMSNRECTEHAIDTVTWRSLSPCLKSCRQILKEKTAASGSRERERDLSGVAAFDEALNSRMMSVALVRHCASNRNKFRNDAFVQNIVNAPFPLATTGDEEPRDFVLIELNMSDGFAQLISICLTSLFSCSPKFFCSIWFFTSIVWRAHTTKCLLCRTR